MGRSLRGWLALALVIPALWLGWQVVALAQAQTYAADDPEEALSWRANFAPALGRLTEELTVDAYKPAEYARAAETARRALVASPLEARALRILGVIADRQGDEKAAERLMTLAARRSLRDPIPHVWLFERRMAERDWKRAMFHADVLMRKPLPTYDARSAVVLAAFEPAAQPALIERMAERPPWRRGVIARVAEVSPPLAFDMLIKLAAAGAGPTDAESEAVVRRMIDDDAAPNAYVAWTQLLPASAAARLGDVYDSDFDGLPGAPPFNWDLAKKAEAGSELAPGPDGEGRTLYVHYGAGKPATLAQQLLLLPAGRYRLTARTYMEEPRRGEQLRWSLACQGASPLAEVDAPDEALVWHDTGAAFEIPPTGCEAQRLVLTAAPARERTGQLRAWIDRVAIRRGG